MGTVLWHTSYCLQCDWRTEGGKADKDAEKHTKETTHATVSSAVPDDGTHGV